MKNNEKSSKNNFYIKERTIKDIPSNLKNKGFIEYPGVIAIEQ